MEDIDKETLRCLIHHIFLPLQLPSKPDSRIHDGVLLEAVISSLSEFVTCNHCIQESTMDLEVALKALKLVRRDNGTLDDDKLRVMLQRVIGGGKSLSLSTALDGGPFLI
jgi:hypothetical protein